MADDRAFEVFVREHATDLLRLATLLAAGRQQGEELLQDTLAHLYPKWEMVGSAQAPVAYVRRAMVNRLISERRGPRRNELVVAAVPESRAVSDPAQLVADRHTLMGMLAQLPDRQRAAVVLRYFHDLSDAQIAVILGCREVTVRSLVSRALAELRRHDHETNVLGREGAR